MSDYSFMKTGSNNNNIIEDTSLTDSELESIEVLLTLFTSNAISNASNYVKYCNRNGITTTDIIYGLKYEVFEFFKRNTLEKDIESMTKDYETSKYEDEGEDDDEGEPVATGEDEDEDENKLDQFERILIKDINNENKDFVEKIHMYYDSWEKWIPQTPIEHILKNSIDKMMTN